MSAEPVFTALEILAHSVEAERIARESEHLERILPILLKLIFEGNELESVLIFEPDREYFRAIYLRRDGKFWHEGMEVNVVIMGNEDLLRVRPLDDLLHAINKYVLQHDSEFTPAGILEAGRCLNQLADEMEVADTQPSEA